MWHFIGHLQSNKVKKAVSLFTTIQSVDSLKLLKKIDHECDLSGRKIDIMFQINVANDPKKHGFTPEDFNRQLPEMIGFSNVQLKGIMCIVPFTKDPEAARPWFKAAKRIFDDAKGVVPQLKELSMGMSHDYTVALEEGSTMVRIGSRLFTDDDK